MRWLKRDIWKAGIALAGMLLLMVLMVWVPVSAAGAYEGASGLATPGTTPTEDATVTALNKEQMTQQIKQLQLQNDRSMDAWLWNSIAALGTIVAAIVASVVAVATVVVNFRQWKKSEIAAMDRDMKMREEAMNKDRVARQDAMDKDLKDKAEERFKTAVTALGDEKEGVQLGGAILLRSFLHKEDKKTYGRYYTQVFDLAVAHLCLPRAAHPLEDHDGIPHSPEDSNTLLPLTPLRKALIVVFKEAFPLARGLNIGSPESLDATLQFN